MNYNGLHETISKVLNLHIYIYIYMHKHTQLKYIHRNDLINILEIFIVIN